MKGLVAVTGGTGFLGIHVVTALVQAGYDVRLLNRPGSLHPLMKVPGPGVATAELDFADAGSLEKALTGCVALIHGAAIVSYDLKDQGKMWTAHVLLTTRLLKAARRVGVKRFVHVSSIVTLGHGREPRDETASYNASVLRLPYWDTKMEAERQALAANAPGFEVVAVNPGSLLGPGERNGQLLPFLRKLSASKSPVLPDGGSDFVDVRDVARGIVLALEKGRPGDRYVLGSENLSYAEFHRVIRSAIGQESRAVVVPKWLLRAAGRLLAIFERLSGLDFPVNSLRLRRVNGVFMFHRWDKAKRELGYDPRPILDAVREMLAQPK